MDWFMGRSKKKENKDINYPDNNRKLYLNENFTRETIHHHLPNLKLPDLNELVTLPSGFSQEEWLAWHTISFFEQLNTFLGVTASECRSSSTSCSSMTAPGSTTYSWVDERGKNKLRCSAPQYIDYVTSYIHKHITDTTIFPTRHGDEFPANFTVIVQKINKYMYHILAHIYYAHYHRIVSMQLHGHLNTFFTHFILFSKTFQLLDNKDTDNMKDLTSALKAALADSKENQSES